MTKRRIVFGAVALLAVAIQFYPPERTNPRTQAADAITAYVDVPSDTARILDRACRDCHSNDTRWPWYSTVAPASWLVIEHVNHGRQHLNFSEWARYDRDRQRTLLERSCSLARERDMPLGSYLFVHSSARLSPADVDVLCRWSQTALR